MALWISVLLMGYLVSSTGISPVQIIVFAQAFNGILLPLSAIILLIAMNNKKVLGNYVNNKVQNVLGIAITVVTIMLGAKKLYSVIIKFL